MCVDHAGGDPDAAGAAGIAGTGRGRERRGRRVASDDRGALPAPNRASTKLAALFQYAHAETVERARRAVAFDSRDLARDTTRGTVVSASATGSAAAAQTLTLYGGTTRRSGASVAGVADDRADAHARESVRLRERPADDHVRVAL